MKIFNLLFDRNEGSKSAQWMSQYTEDKNNKRYLKFVCSTKSDNSINVVLLATIGLIEEYGKGNLKYSDMHVAPLYRKTVIAHGATQKETMLIHVTAAEGKKISSIKLEGAVLSGPIHYNEERTMAACAVIQLNSSNKYMVKIFQNDGSLILIDNGKITNKKVTHEIIMPKILKAPQILAVPNKALITNDPANVTKPGYISVLTKAILSPIAIISEKEKSEQYLVAKDVSDADLALIASKLTKPLIRV